MSEVTVRPATSGDAPAITAIYNASVAVDTASWDEDPETPQRRAQWLQERDQAGDVVLVAERDGAVVGYAGYGPFRPKSGYRLTREHSVYLADDARGQGIGRLLLTALIEAARARGVHALIGGLSQENIASLRLHEALGFREVGRLPQVGAKFGRWLDLVLVELVLDDAPQPPGRPDTASDT
ncbi:MAG: GNAT family N-acetyltransferase [Propionibacteriaceae bacterium]|nr:GNAT family N-acetyltransferase [Propionibacteriaceae bacterium]